MCVLMNLQDNLATSRSHPLTQVQGSPQKWPHNSGQDDCSGATTDEVDHEEGKRGHCWEEELVAPAEVEDIIGKPKEDHTADTEQSCTQVLDELRGGEGWGE